MWYATAVDATPAEVAPPLTPRQTQVARLFARGSTLVEVGRRLRISVHTVRVHLRNAYEAIGVSNRTELLRWLAREGAVDMNAWVDEGRAPRARGRRRTA